MMISSNKWRFIAPIMGCLLSTAGWAGQPGQVEPSKGSPNLYRVTLRDGQLANVAGSTYRHDFSLSGTYPGTFYCAKPKEVLWGPVHYRALTNLPVSDINGAAGYHRLNDYIDIRIDMYIAGNRNTYFLVPFPDQDNDMRISFQCNSANPPTASHPSFGSGSKGYVTFKLRKPIVNGIDINMREIVDMFGRVNIPGIATDFGGIPMARVMIETALLTVPDKCVVNDGRTIEVDFKDIPQASMDGSRYIQSIPVSYQCSGGSFDKGMKGIGIGLSARPAAFSDNYVASNAENLAVVVKHKGQVVKPNEFTKMPETPSNSGRWDLTAAPITNGSDIALGDFTASATIVMEFNEVD